MKKILINSFALILLSILIIPILYIWLISQSFVYVVKDVKFKNNDFWKIINMLSKFLNKLLKDTINYN